MADEQAKHSVSRRAALKMIAGSAGATVGLPILNNPRAQGASRAPSARAQGSPYTPEFFDDRQMKTLAAIAETIIPADDHSPGAKAARVDEYIDETVADLEQNAKNFWTEGLAGIDRRAGEKFGKKFVDCKAGEQEALLEAVSANEEHPATLEEKFFVALKRATIDGYYNSEIGIHQDLQYQGNTALAEFEGCSHPEHKAEFGPKT